MNYTSISFYLFLAAAAAVYYAVPVFWRWMVLLAGSIAFYFLAYKTGWWIVLASVLMTYAAGLCLEHLGQRDFRSGHRIKKAVFIAALVLTVLPWFCVKNGDFLTGLLHRPSFHWIVPLGISFYTLQMAAYLADIYTGKIHAQKNPAKYALFVLFFPQIVQGPIPRYKELAGQLYQGHLFDEREFAKGFQLIVWGFFLKFMIADKAAVAVNEIFSRPDIYRGCYVFAAGVLYSLELYADFLACTQICRGSAGLFGIHLKGNFMRPYLVVSVKDFWRRWHMSLSSWLRDYIYIPLGGSRRGTLSKYLNLAVTFAVSGIWHGAGYKFLFWGLLHAAYQTAGNMTAGMQDWLYERVFKLHKASSVRRALQRAGVFFWVMTAWVIFRADSLTTGLDMVMSMFTVHNPWIFFNDSLLALGLSWKEWCVLAVSLLLLAFVERKQERGESIRDSILRMPFYMRWSVYTAAILGTMIFGTYGFGFDAQDFIYRGF